MPDFDHKTYLFDQLQQARSAYILDLEALTEAELVAPVKGTARTPFDFTYEVIVVNNRFAERLRGEDPGAWPFGEGWAVAPPEYRNKPRALEDFQSSMEAVRQALGDDLYRTISTPSGNTTPYELGLFCALHVMYHDAQLNYIQELSGDMKMHWTEE